MSKPQKGAKTITWLSPILCLLCFFVALGQQNDTYELWRIRSQTITDDLLKDAAQLSPLRRAVLWTRLAQHWWAYDRARSRNWILNAIEIVEEVPNKENPDDRRERLETARLMLKIISPLDQKLAMILVGMLNDNEEQWTQAERSDNAEALMLTGITFIDKDPRHAAELFSQSLRMGPPSDISTMLLAMRKRDPKLADALFTQALTLAKQSLSFQMLSSLTYAAFPEYKGISDTEFIPPQQFRTELLQLDMAFLNANSINDENRNSVCVSIGGFIAPLMKEFERSPQQATIVRQAMSQCHEVHPLVQANIDSTMSDDPPNTIEALLKIASDSRDPKVRTVYEYRAATMAKENKDYERALKILDGVSEEGREFMDGAWESYRWDWAAMGALEYYKAGRVLEMNLILNGVPADLQPFAKAAFVDRLPDKRSAAGDPALQFLNDARAGLRRSNARESEKVGCYFFLLRLIVKYDRSGASAAIKEAFAAMNKAEQSNPDKDRKSLNSTEYLKLVPASLLEVDEFTVREGIASLTTVETRAQIRFALLNSTIERMRPAKRVVP
jgi:hypothetical protein